VIRNFSYAVPQKDLEVSPQTFITHESDTIPRYLPKVGMYGCKNHVSHVTWKVLKWTPFERGAPTFGTLNKFIKRHLT